MDPAHRMRAAFSLDPLKAAVLLLPPRPRGGVVIHRGIGRLLHRVLTPLW